MVESWPLERSCTLGVMLWADPNLLTEGAMPISPIRDGISSRVEM